MDGDNSFFSFCRGRRLDELSTGHLWLAITRGTGRNFSPEIRRTSQGRMGTQAEKAVWILSAGRRLRGSGEKSGL
jgi:hypothetical protein